VADPELQVVIDRDGYTALLGRILQASSAGALEALVPEIAYFTSPVPRRREQLAQAWFLAWDQHVGTPVRSDLWPNVL
jgi:hypothetical protein